MPASCKAVKAKSCLRKNNFNGPDVEKLQRIIQVKIIENIKTYPLAYRFKDHGTNINAQL